MSWKLEELELCASLDELRDTTLLMMEVLVGQGYEIHHVAGAISADGDEFISRNIDILRRYRDQLDSDLGEHVIVVTAPVVLTDAVYANLKIFEMSREERESVLKDFWRKLIDSKLISCIHFCPGWERSEGAMDEHQAAQDFGVKINYLKDELR